MRTGFGRRLAPLIVLLVALAAAATPAHAEGEIDGSLPDSGGVALIVWSGGPATDLVEAARERSCLPVSIWASDGAGGVLGRITDAPAFVNAAWLEAFPGDQAPDGPLVLVCGPPPSVFADAQIVSLYGYPGIDAMGILGQMTPQAAAVEARRRADEYDALNGARDVVPALQPIVIVAQSSPGASGDYIGRMPAATIRDYVEVAREEGLLLILDVQLGWADPMTEIRALEPYLVEPFVHLAIDPEFMTRSDDLPPGQAIGTVEAATVNAAQAYLDDLVREHGLPRKVLVVHQFREDMIEVPASGRFADYPRVDVTIDMDGFGPSGLKIEKYGLFAQSTYAERGAIKLFLDHDTPLLTPAQIQALTPPPDLVIYQ